MKNVSLFGILPLLALVFSPVNTPVEGTTSYAVDTQNSVVKWKAYKVTGQHEGTVTLENGKLDFTDGVLTGGSFDLNMTSIDCTDLEGEWKDKLVGHLKSPDFFAVEEFPNAQFVITRAISRGTPGDYKVIGNLTIKGITQEIKFLANVTETEGKATATADIKLDRSEYNIRYGSGSFFDNLGDKTIYDEFDLSVQLVTAK